MGETAAMGFDVRALITLRKAPSEALMTELDHRFGLATHEVGTKTVSIVEHVSVSDAGDALAFVRGLIEEAIPSGAEISELVVSPDAG
jgi:hypothetical protein